MKRISIFASIFAVSFLLAAGAMIFTSNTVEAKIPPWCKIELPCDIEDIYCTQTPCTARCKGFGGIFYCAPDWITEYCSAEWWYPVPCSN